MDKSEIISLIKELKEKEFDPKDLYILCSQKEHIEEVASNYLTMLEEHWNEASSFLPHLNDQIFSEFLVQLSHSENISSIRKEYIVNIKYKQQHYIPIADVKMLVNDRYEQQGGKR